MSPKYQQVNVFLDSAFPLLRNLLVPFKESSDSPLEPPQTYYNLVHSRTRQKVEHSFGLLTARWRFLWKHLYMLDIDRMVKTIHACCCLHNICIDMKDSGEFIDNRNFDEFVRMNSATGNEDEPNFAFNELIGLDNIEYREAVGTRGGSARNELLRRFRDDGVELRNNIMQSLYEEFLESHSQS